MDFVWLKNVSNKIFWPLAGIYILYMVYKVYQYYSGIHLVVDKTIYNQWYLKQLYTTGGILLAGIALKISGQNHIATIALVVPAGITCIITLLTILIWLVLAVAFILFGK